MLVHPLRLPLVDRLASGMRNFAGWRLVRLDQRGEPLLEEDRGWTTIARVEVRADDELLGYLAAAPAPGRHAPAAEQQPPNELLSTLAELIGAWIGALRLARDNDDELTTLIELTRLMTSSVDLSRILFIACEAAASAVEARGAALWMLDESRTRLVARALFGFPFDTAQVPPIVLSESPADLEASAGDPVILRSISHDPRCRSWPALLRDGADSGLCVGLRSKEQTLGTLHVFADQGTEFSLHSVRLLMAIAGQVSACIEQSSLRRESQAQRRWTRELAAASEVQAALLPRDLPQIDGFELAVHFQPVRAVGGDLYDFIPFGEKDLGIAIGDASGKSVTGALLMATVRGGLRAYVEDHFHISEVLRRLNLAIHQATFGEYFMTLFYGVLNIPSRELTHASAGHDPPLLIQGGRCVDLIGGGVVLGADPRATYPFTRTRIEPGGVLVFSTDGATELASPTGELFGRLRLRDAAIEAAHRSAEGILESILKRLDEFRGSAPIRDDLTLLVLKAKI